MHYLTYDIRGIQRYIFAVPQLKFIVGGSAMIDGFDRTTVRKRDDKEQPGVSLQFSGGGKGTFECEDKKQADKLSGFLREKAHEIGLDIRIGRSENLEDALNGQQKLYPVPIESLEGEPCSASGLFPVMKGKGEGYRNDSKTIHPLIWQRLDAVREDALGARLLGILEKNCVKDWPSDLPLEQCQFFRNVNPEDEVVSAEENNDDGSLAQAGAAAIGGEGRWAVVAMDGNDMGAQMTSAREKFKNNREDFTQWVGEMSRAIDESITHAAAKAAACVVKQWWGDIDKESGGKGKKKVTVKDGKDAGKIILPIRPLIVGGDDALFLVHSSYAFMFATELSKHYTQHAKKINGEYRNSHDDKHLWCGTGGSVTLSGGIAFVPVKFPVHTAIELAESLQASAKGKFRGEMVSEGGPSPSALDWEQFTESAYDDLALRRHRDLYFKDGDRNNQKIHLTNRPYRIDELAGKLDVAMKLLVSVDDQGKEKIIPGKTRHDLRVQLRQPYQRRRRYLAVLAKNHSDLAKKLKEDLLPEEGGESKTILSTCVLDVCALLDQGHRFVFSSDD